MVLVLSSLSKGRGKCFSLISANIWPIFRRGLRPGTHFLWRQHHLKVTPLSRIASRLNSATSKSINLQSVMIYPVTILLNISSDPTLNAYMYICTRGRWPIMLSWSRLPRMQANLRRTDFPPTHHPPRMQARTNFPPAHYHHPAARRVSTLFQLNFGVFGIDLSGCGMGVGSSP